MNSDFLIENGVLTAYCGEGGEVCVPDGVTEIGERAFYECRKLTALRVPAGLRAIGPEAFSDCRALASVRFPDSLETIGDFAFAGCRSLEELSLPEGLKVIDRSAFSPCAGLKRVTLPESLDVLGEFAFSCCRALRELTLPKRMERIDRSAFSQCWSLTRVDVPAGLEKLERSVFYGCRDLREVTLPKELSAVSTGAFTGCDRLQRITVDAENPALQDINGVLYSRDGVQLLLCPGGLAELAVPEAVTEIGPEAFRENRNLDRVTLPEGLETIGAAAFYRCGELAELKLPPALRTIGEDALNGCRALRRLSLPDSVETVGAGALRGCSRLMWLRLPAGLDFDPHWFTELNDPDCFSLDRTVLPFATTRRFEEIDSKMGARRAALGFIRAEIDGEKIAPEIRQAYLDSIRDDFSGFRAEMLADDDVLRWMAAQQLIPPQAVESLLEEASEAGRASASVLLLDYQKRANVLSAIPDAPQPGQLDQRFAALENAFDL